MNTSGVVFQCASCRALVVAGTIVVDDGVKRAGLQCTACGAVTYLPIAGADENARAHVVVDADAAARAAPPSRALPSSTSASALVPAANAAVGGWSPDVYERIVARVAKIDAASSPAQIGLAADFDRLLGRWSEEGEHSKFLKKAASVEELAFAGQRYRAVLEVLPADAAAKKAQSDLMAMAMATFSAQKNLGGVASDGSGMKTLQVVGVAVLTIAFAIAAIWFLPKLLPPADGGATMDAPATGRSR